MTRALFLLKCASIAFVVGFLASDGPGDLLTNLVPLAGVMVLVTAALVLFELTNLEPATGVAMEAI